MKDSYLYGVRRGSAMVWPWQPFGSKAPHRYRQLSPGCWSSRRLNFAMAARVLGVNPAVLVVPPELEGDALQILERHPQRRGHSNVWQKTAG